MDASLLLVLKIAASACIGLLIGLEREWAHKDAGIRSFALTALLGTLSWLVTPALVYAEVAIVLLIMLLINVYAFLKEQNLEITTSIALAVTNVLGITIGMGNFLLAFTCALIITALLSWKTELITFSGKLTIEEIRGTLLLGFITAVIYPLLPDHPIDPWNLVNPRTIWLTIIIVSGLNFINYVLLRVFGTRGIRYSAILGGLVNSAATAVLLGQETTNDVSQEADAPTNILLADMAMILRNWVLVMLFALPRGLKPALPTLLILIPMMLAAGGLALLLILRMNIKSTKPSQKPALKSPLDLRSVLIFGLLFLALTVISGLAKRIFGAIGFLAVIVIGALASAASSSVLVGQQIQKGQVGDLPAAIAIFLATVAGLLENIVIYWVITRKPALGWRLVFYTLPIIFIGIAILVLTLLFHWA
ncbi:DUF4010 domain-containing protein [Ktedonosporobacter rubrisoli]|uniref:DUF4010 domain-containing protein n=1 Tax=Ktedonosporobacter rubrisoli TaxID=2509675 RepID=A0A4P6JTM6_KTERU|nr:DUF4010 domain-containing protein [Ktedonosporobacter rubrisoli]QBD78673.1 DUF4010 domain-containing protein [Ktedonosporobacter rubrisoli]